VSRGAARWIWLPALAGVAFLAVPLAALVLRTVTSGALGEIARPEVLPALRLSLICSFAATVLCLAPGMALGWVLAREPFPGQRWLRGLVMLPMVLPPVVGGVALLLAFGRRGIVGEPFARVFGVTLPFTTAGVVVAEAFVALPFLVAAVEAGVRQLDRRYAEAAAVLGAGPLRRLWTVTLPLLAPALVSGATLAWARALGEFGATITFAGNLPGVTQTMPLAVYLALETRPEAAMALSLVLLVTSAAVLVGLRGRWLGA
jgi:molybdate transport system permease protein